MDKQVKLLDKIKKISTRLNFETNIEQKILLEKLIKIKHFYDELCALDVPECSPEKKDRIEKLYKKLVEKNKLIKATATESNKSTYRTEIKILLKQIIEFWKNTFPPSIEGGNKKSYKNINSKAKRKTQKTSKILNRG